VVAARLPSSGERDPNVLGVVNGLVTMLSRSWEDRTGGPEEPAGPGTVLAEAQDAITLIICPQAR
jgi:hypothetical protein